jgi:NTE family protein
LRFTWSERIEGPGNPPMCMTEKKIGVALGSGAARGLAHIGVLKVLEAEGIRIDCITGSSAGAIIGACYASGASLKELEEISLGLTIYKLVSFTLPRRGLIDFEKIRAVISPFVGELEFKDLKIPMGIMATEIDTDTSKVFSEGNIMQAIQASTAVPGILQPVILDEHVYVDGGVKDPVPVEATRNLGADVVIAVNLNHYVTSSSLLRKVRKGEDQSDFLLRLKRMFTSDSNIIFDIIGRSLDIMQRELTVHRFELSKPDVVICPKIGHLRVIDFDKAEEFISAGEEAARECIGQIREVLERT